MRWLCLVCLLVPSFASAQDAGIASIEVLRARATARGFVRADVGGARPYESWCAVQPCAATDERFELYVRDGSLVELHVVGHPVGDGFVLDGFWQLNGTFRFCFGRREEVACLSWELAFAPAGFLVGTSAHTAWDGLEFAPWIRRELSLNLSSAASMRDTALAQRTQLRAAAALVLRPGMSMPVDPSAHCSEERRTPYGMAFFDVCPRRPATPEEVSDALATLDARSLREGALILRHFVGWHRALRETFGTDDDGASDGPR